jgi:hypothetical protein
VSDPVVSPTAVLAAAPDGRAWRVATASRALAGTGPGVLLGELTEARTRKLHVDLRGPATAECVVNGRSSQTYGLTELSQDLVLYRWNPVGGAFECLFRGPIGRTQDVISETVHTLTVTAADYRALLARLPAVVTQTWTGLDQATMVKNLVAFYGGGSFVPFDLRIGWGGVLNPDGTVLGDTTGVARDRSYTADQLVGDAVDKLAACLGGFDWSAEPTDPSTQANQAATVTLWYPRRGVTKSFVAGYGTTVSSLTRAVNSTDFANWVLTIGKGMTTTSAGDVSSNPAAHPEGLWGDVLQAADVSVAATLQQQSDGYLALHSQVAPAYSATLVPGAWNQRSDGWLGDTVTLRVASGRLNVDTTVRIVAVDFDVDDSGTERVALTLGRADVTLADALAGINSTLDALTRR